MTLASSAIHHRHVRMMLNMIITFQNIEIADLSASLYAYYSLLLPGQQTLCRMTVQSSEKSLYGNRNICVLNSYS